MGFVRDLDQYQEKRNGYNDEPVLYCKSCLSLNIRNISSVEDSDYCESCGSTNIGECGIEDWERMYKARYGTTFVDRRR